MKHSRFSLCVADFCYVKGRLGCLWHIQKAGNHHLKPFIVTGLLDQTLEEEDQEVDEGLGLLLELILEGVGWCSGLRQGGWRQRCSPSPHPRHLPAPLG